ncbi:MAG TPA: hypothetical protein VK324_10950 [Tepidisphaeraceae bacterium]|nr:hypothetical protein [Tepidisphaeraceae bacterium]
MSRLEQLENNEAVLQLYLADELSAEDRAEVEQMLAVDANLRREFEVLRDGHARLTAALRDLDVAECPPLCDDAAVRQATRAMRQWSLTHVRAAPAPAKRGLAYPWFVYPIATAASVLLAVLVWWGMSDVGGGSIRNDRYAAQSPVRHDGGWMETAVPAEDALATAQAEALRVAFETADEFRTTTTARLDDAERQIREVQAAANNDDPLLFGGSDL